MILIKSSSDIPFSCESRDYYSLVSDALLQYLAELTALYLSIASSNCCSSIAENLPFLYTKPAITIVSICASNPPQAAVSLFWRDEYYIPSFLAISVNFCELNHLLAKICWFSDISGAGNSKFVILLL